MFAICSITEFKPEKVAVNSNPNKFNNPVNLDHVRTFHKEVSFVFGAKNSNYHTIVFQFNSSDYATWYFHSQEECDAEFGKILYKIHRLTEKS